MRQVLAPTVVLLLIARVAAAQTSGPSLLEIARQHGSANSAIISCGPTPTLADIAGRADLAIRGVVRTRISQLSADASTVFTDFDIAVHEVLFQTRVLTTDRPGVVPSNVFRTGGGRVTVDGLQISLDAVSNNARVTLSVGDEAYIFAHFDPKSATWWFSRFEVFSVSGSAVTGHTTETSKGVDDETFRLMLANIRSRPPAR